MWDAEVVHHGSIEDTPHRNTVKLITNAFWEHARLHWSADIKSEKTNVKD